VQNDHTGDDRRQNQKRVGRVSLAWLRGPDPEYPVLPQWHGGDVSPPNSLTAVQQFTRSAEDTPDAIMALHTRLLGQVADEEDDEFADSELEGAFQLMDFDAEGKLKEATISTIKSRESRGHARLEQKAEAEEVSASEETRADVEVSNYNPISLTDEAPTTTSAPTFQPLPVAANNQPSHSPEYTHATRWAEDYLRSTIPSPTSTAPSRIRATIPHLRAYHLWHTQHLSLDAIASHLRDPPLSHNTVTGYVMQAVTLERLEYDKEAMRALMMSLPVGMRKGRFKWMAEKVGASR
jgi:hypothetical protein